MQRLRNLAIAAVVGLAGCVGNVKEGLSFEHNQTWIKCGIMIAEYEQAVRKGLYDYEGGEKVREYHMTCSTILLMVN